MVAAFAIGAAGLVGVAVFPSVRRSVFRLATEALPTVSGDLLHIAVILATGLITTDNGPGRHTCTADPGDTESTPADPEGARPMPGTSGTVVSEQSLIAVWSQELADHRERLKQPSAVIIMLFVLLLCWTELKGKHPELADWIEVPFTLVLNVLLSGIRVN